MTKPTFSKRLAGHPPVTAALFLLYGLLILGWLKGGVPWWLASIAVIAAMRTFRAFRAMRAYSAWLASWQEMGTEDSATVTAQVPAKQAMRRRPGRAFVIIALLLAVILPVAFRHSPPPGVMWLWAIAVLFLVGRAVYQLGRFGQNIAARPRRQTATAEEVKDDAPVAWLLPRASSSPSLAEAGRRLPDYSARLLAAGSDRQAALIESAGRN